MTEKRTFLQMKYKIADDTMYTCTQNTTNYMTSKIKDLIQQWTNKIFEDHLIVQGTMEEEISFKLISRFY